jgi:acyl-CoA thioesterase FadM
MEAPQHDRKRESLPTHGCMARDYPPNRNAMNRDLVGSPSYHTRVENWEIDFNGHWNTRFYARTFQLAAETVASLGEGTNPGAAVIRSRQIRFHHELFPGAAIEVRSVTVAGGHYDSAVVHLLFSGGRIAATSLDQPGIGSAFLPRVPAEELSFAFPRGLDAATPLPWKENVDASLTVTVEVGAVRPSETDHTGNLLFDELIRRCAHASHDHVIRMGLSPEFTEKTGVGRMLAEMRATRLGYCTPGQQLKVSSRLIGVAGKSFTTAHYIQTRAGSPVALIELCTLAVDMKTRKATYVPDILRQQLQTNSEALHRSETE